MIALAPRFTWRCTFHVRTSDLMSQSVVVRKICNGSMSKICLQVLGKNVPGHQVSEHTHLQAALPADVQTQRPDTHYERLSIGQHALRLARRHAHTDGDFERTLGLLEEDDLASRR